MSDDDHSSDNTASGDHVQWVNIRRGDTQAYDGAPEPRIDYFEFVTTFQNARRSAYEADALPLGDNIQYRAPDELGRNANFSIKGGNSIVENQGKQKVKASLRLYLPAAGGNGYFVKGTQRIHGRAKPIEKFADRTVTVRRKLFFQSIEMDRIGGAGYVPGAIQHLIKEYWKSAELRYLRLREMASNRDARIPHRPVVDIARLDEFFAVAAPFYRMQGFEPYAFAILWVDRLAESEILTLPFTVTAGVLEEASKKGGLVAQVHAKKPLWYFVEGSNDWLIHVTAHYSETKAPVRVEVSLADPKKVAPQRDVRLQLKDEVPLFGGKRKITVILTARVVGEDPWGYTRRGTNVAIVSTRSTEEHSVSVERLGGIASHEVAHLLGMLPPPPPKVDAGLPDGHSQDGLGSGGHCPDSGCALHKFAGKPHLCALCGKVLRKVDVRPPLPGFSKTLREYGRRP